MGFENHKIYDPTGLSKKVLNKFLFEYVDSPQNTVIRISDKLLDCDMPYILIKDKEIQLINDERFPKNIPYSEKTFQLLLLNMLSDSFEEAPFELLYLLEEKRKEVAEFIKNLIVLLEVEDKRTSMSHTQRVAFYSKKWAEYMKKDSYEIELIYDVAMLHDVGRIGIEQLMLFSKTRVFELEQWDLEHTVAGSVFLGNRKELWYAMDVVRSHHEFWNGTGFPDHLKGEEIPYHARLIGIVDWFDWATHTATSEHFGILSPEEALNYIEFNLGKKFDPNLGQSFIDFMKDFLKREKFI